MSQPYENAYRVGAERTARVIVTTGTDIVGYRIIEYLGVVRGIVVRSPNIGQSLVGAFKQIVGGNMVDIDAALQMWLDPAPDIAHPGDVRRRL